MMPLNCFPMHHGLAKQVIKNLILSTGILVCPISEAYNDLFNLSLEELLSIQVSSASRSDEYQGAAPARVKLVTRAQISQRGYVNLFDLLRDLPGFDTQAYSHETTYNQVSSRGVVGNNRFVIQRDGIPIDSPAGDPIAIADNFPLFNIDRVEIVYGPASSLYGADAFSGVINLITNQEEGGQLTLKTGQNDYEYLAGNFHHSFASKSYLNVSAHQHVSDNPNLVDAYPMEFILSDLVRFDGSIAVPLNQRTHYYGKTESHSVFVQLGVEEDWLFTYNQSQFVAPTTTGLRPNTVDYGAEGFWQMTLATVAAIYSTDLSEKVDLRVLGSWQSYDVDARSKFNNLFSSYENGYKYADSAQSAVDIQLTYNVADAKQVIFGGVFEEFDAIPKTTDLSQPFNSGVPNPEQNIYYVGTDDTLPVKIFNLSYSNKGAYIQYRDELFEELKMIAGMRVDDNSQYGSTTNFRGGFIFEANDRLTWKLLYGEAFLAPAPEFTYEHFGAFGAVRNSEGLFESGFMFIPNPQLEPETSSTLELNLSYRLSASLSIEASIYSVKVDDLILNTTTSEPVSDFIAGGEIAVTANNDNVGEIEVLGFDAEFLYIDELAKGSLDLWINYSYLNTEFTDDTRAVSIEAPFTADHKFKAGISYNIERFFCSLAYHWIGDTAADTPQIDPVTTPGFKAGGYSLFNFNAGFNDVLPGLDISVKIENLLDERYYNAGTGVNITFVESPQNPRHYSAQVRYRF